MPNTRLLIAEDEEHLGAILEHFLRGRGYEVTMCRDGKSALAKLRTEAYDVALIDIVMPEMDGLEVLRHLQAEPDPPEVIIITGNGTVDTAVTAIKLGAYDYVSKPYRMAEIDVMVRRAWEKRELSRSNLFLRTCLRAERPSSVVAESESMRAVVAGAAAVAPSDDVVVLHGATGVGKTCLARYVHEMSGRSRDVYVEMTGHDDAGADGVLAHLFGCEPGGEGAPARRVGVLQLAASGTVVIDTAVLDADARAALAHALRQRAFTRLGGTQRIPLSARVVLCERTDVPHASDPGEFPGTHLTIRPLRERPEDIGVLAARMARHVGDGAPRTLAPDAAPVLLHYAWPGNAHELRAVMMRAALLARRREITAADVRMVLFYGVGSGGDGARLADLERTHVEAMLVRNGWHQGRAARALGISTKTLYRKMREYGLVRPRRRQLARRDTPRSDTPPAV